METRIGTYRIENMYPFTSIKDLGWPKILVVESHQWCEILHEGHQWYENDEIGGSSYSTTFNASNPGISTDDNKVTDIGTLSLSSFVNNYMVNKCKYKGGGLGKFG